VYLSPLNLFWVNNALSGLFVLFGLTDFLDGYLARRLGEVTQLGKILDPIADKFLIYATLVALLAAQKIFFLWVLIFIGREFFIMGLRIVALEHHMPVSVSWFGKIKTIAQMAYLAVVIANPNHSFSLHASTFNQLEAGLLAVTLLITVWSIYHYYRAFARAMYKHNEPL